MPTKKYDIIPFGDSAFLVKFATEGYSEKVTRHIHAVIETLRKHADWEELVPGYNSLLAYFCPTEFQPSQARSAVAKALKANEKSGVLTGKLIEMPVCYGGDHGPDMTNIQKSSGLSVDEIIKLHSAPIYDVCMMGFIPGFTFLSEAPKALHHNRRETPRAVVPAGSVGIAGWQTGVYGLESPGGWQLIGQTPLSIFDSLRDKPFLLQAGDRVKFVPIGSGDFS